MATSIMNVPGLTAHERFKRHSRTISWEALIIATVVHFLVFAYWPKIEVADVSFDASELSMVELPPQVEIPPPPQTIARPAAPVISAAKDVSPDITIAMTTFESQPAAALPAPPAARAASKEELARAPVFTPYTVSPTLRNREEAAAALRNSYPPILRNAGIGGVALLWFFIDDNGRVVRTVLKETSGQEQLDAAAVQVASVMQFSPAMNRDMHVPVWVAIPITFIAK
jgi:TonB family protein